MRHVLSPSLLKKSKKTCVWMSSSVRQQSDCKVFMEMLHLGSEGCVSCDDFDADKEAIIRMEEMC
jgi:hypothetical protein